MNNNYILVKIEGKNVSNYIKWLVKNKINIINLKVIKHNELNVVIDYKFYHLLTKYSKTYKVTILKKYGKLRLIDMIKNNIIILLSLILSIFFLYFLSHIIFSVDILYNNQEIVNIVNKELKKYDIKKYKFKKNHKYLEEVKKQILKDNQDFLEWLEIEESGTKYIIRIVERKKETKKEEYMYQSIIAKKDATIVSIKASSGEKIKTINQYVKKGDTIISGVLTKPDNTNLYTKAEGKVLGEVWYKIDIEYPLYYQEEKITGKSKNIISIYFLNKEIPLLPYKKYKQFNRLSKTLVENNILPITIKKEKLYEVVIKEDIYTFDEAVEKAINEAQKKLIEKNKNILYIKDSQILDKHNLNSKIKLSLFISSVEDITDFLPINPDEIVEKQ